MLSPKERATRRPGARSPARSVIALCAALAGTPVTRAQEAAATLVGDAACEACHGDRVHSFHQTAHSRTSSLPSPESIHGKFAQGSNLLKTINANLVFLMEANERGYFQTARMKTSATEELSRSERIDVVVGSGRKGQTYLYWDGDQLFQLPVSYWTSLDAWVDSPGYADGTADFERPIVPRCLECHSSSFASRAPPENRYDRASLVLGVSCEKCHGPGSEHVARFRSRTPPTTPSAFAIVNPARLSRARQLDVCALCHNGAGEPLAPALSFHPGGDLSQSIAFSKADPGVRVDVHARQVPLLERSRCFRFSKTMTCTTCHDVHTPQRDAASFASRCMTCHKVEGCRDFPKLGHAIEARCIECHMPLQETGKIVSQVVGATIRPMVRNHQIAIYRDIALSPDSSRPR